jgi:hypothetical protein
VLLHIIGRCRLLEVLHEDNGPTVRWATQASKAADYLLSFYRPTTNRSSIFLKQDLSPRGAGNIHDEVMNAWHITIVSVAMRTITVMIYCLRP